MKVIPYRRRTLSCLLSHERQLKVACQNLWSCSSSKIWLLDPKYGVASWILIPRDCQSAYQTDSRALCRLKRQVSTHYPADILIKPYADLWELCTEVASCKLVVVLNTIFHERDCNCRGQFASNSIRNLMVLQTSDFMHELSSKLAANTEIAGKNAKRLPALQTLFSEGQLVRATITALDQAPSGSCPLPIHCLIRICCGFWVKLEMSCQREQQACKEGFVKQHCLSKISANFHYISRSDTGYLPEQEIWNASFPRNDSQNLITTGAKGVVRKKVTLSLRVAKLNAGISADALQEGLPLPASVRSVEDHGYTLDLGIKVCRPQAWHDITSIIFASIKSISLKNQGARHIWQRTFTFQYARKILQN